MTGLAPGAILEGRYRIEQVVPSGTGCWYLGTALETGALVKVLELPPLVLRSLGRAHTLEHPNLCAVIEAIFRPGGHGLAVVEHVSGSTLEDHLAVERKVGTDLAVVAALDLAGALVALHQRGAAHGLLTPGSVIVAPEGRTGVVLGHAPLLGPPNPYHCPERGVGPPSPADDVWALAALVHQMLLGEPPPSTGYRSRAEVVAAGVTHDELAMLLGNCLARRPENRVSMAHAVRDLLATLSATQSAASPDIPSSTPVASDPSPLPPESAPVSAPRSLPSRPPPPDLPPSTPTTQVQPVVAPRPTPKRGLGAVWYLVVGAALVLVAVVTLTATRSNRVVLEPPASKADLASSSRAASSSQASSAVPPPVAAAPSTSAGGSREVRAARQLSGPELAACVMAHLPPDSFKVPPKVDWLCTVSDPRRGYSRLRSALVLGAKGDVTKAMSLWSRVRWYGMASFTVIRATCCTESPPLELPPTASCGSTAEILNDLHDVVVADKDYGPVLERYTRNVRCHSQQGRDRFFGVDGELGGGQRTAFDELMELRRK